ncbi:MAG: SUMF1/EgtB/PvdO family nonheme iron enzyme [Isosphaeraceae bacterium]
MRPLKLALLFWGLPCLAMAARDLDADYPVDLRRWDDRAILVRNPGPGEEFFALTAYADWQSDAPRDPSQYQLRVTLPDGRALTSSLPRNQAPPSHHVTFLIPRASVLNILPASVRLTAQVIDARTGADASRPLVATIADFPTPLPSRADRRKFGWGRPINAGGASMALPQTSPSGLEFVRIRPTNGQKPFLIARTEVSNAQARKALGDTYTPNEGRTDNFQLDADDQPAMNLTPRRATDLVEALSASDHTGLQYRLPTRQEWGLAARAGRESGCWWGEEDSPAPRGAANFLGAEAGLLTGDTTATPASKFVPNPFGLEHAFGNVAEWATTEEPGKFARLGGHFRTDPKAANFRAELFETTVDDADTMGDANDPGRPFVGVRPVVELNGETGTAAVRQALADIPELADVQVAFDPERGSATLRGQVGSARSRRLADERLHSVWFVSAVEDELTNPTPNASRLATLGDVTGPAVRTSPLTRWTDLVHVGVQWADDLPVTGSEWYVNVFLPDGRVASHKLPEIKPRIDGRSTFVVPLGEARSAGLPDGGPAPIALSLGAPATSQSDPRVVSDVKSIRWLPANSVPTPTPAVRR